MYSFSENSGGKLPEQEALVSQFYPAKMFVTLSTVYMKLLLLYV